MAKIAVFIDAENVSHRHCSRILQKIREEGQIIVCKVVADFSSEYLKKWKIRPQENPSVPMNLIQCDRITGKGNESDFQLYIEIMNCLAECDEKTMFYLVTNDVDFLHIILEICRRGKVVNGIGSDSENCRANTSLKDSYDNFISLEHLLEKEESKRESKRKRLKRVIEQKRVRKEQKRARRKKVVEAKEQARLEAEEQAMREAEEQAMREAEEQARLEAEEQAMREERLKKPKGKKRKRKKNSKKTKKPKKPKQTNKKQRQEIITDWMTLAREGDDAQREQSALELKKLALNATNRDAIRKAGVGIGLATS